MNFTNFEEVSINAAKERLKVKFIGNHYFAAEDTQTIDDEDLSISKEIPLQLEESFAETLGKITVAISKTSKAVMVANFVMNLFFGGALSTLFGAIGKLQIMVHLLITNVLIPANA